MSTTKGKRCSCGSRDVALSTADGDFCKACALAIVSPAQEDHRPGCYMPAARDCSCGLDARRRAMRRRRSTR